MRPGTPGSSALTCQDPKSSSFTSPLGASRTSEGFRSRCSTPSRCAWARPSHIWRHTSSTRSIGKQRAATHHLRQAHARHELGRDPGAAVVLPHSENRRDVRVAQGAGRLRVALHAPDRPGRVAGGRAVELDRHRAVVIGVPRHVGDAARAAAELAAHLEWTERLRRLQSASRSADSIPLRAGSPRKRACYRGGSARRLRRRCLADGDRHRPRPRGDWARRARARPLRRALRRQS